MEMTEEAKLGSLVTGVDELAADVIRLSVEPLLKIARHSKLALVASHLEQAIASSGMVRTAEAQSSDLVQPSVTIDGDPADRHDLIMDHILSSFRQLKQLRSEIMAAPCHADSTANAEQKVVKVNASIKLVSWLAATQSAIGDVSLKAKAEILLDWVGHNDFDPADQLAASLCRDILCLRIADEPGGTVLSEDYGNVRTLGAKYRKM
jgi:hypothetical protein